MIYLETNNTQAEPMEEKCSPTSEVNEQILSPNQILLSIP